MHAHLTNDIGHEVSAQYVLSLHDTQLCDSYYDKQYGG